MHFVTQVGETLAEAFPAERQGSSSSSTAYDGSSQIATLLIGGPASVEQLLAESAALPPWLRKLIGAVVDTTRGGRAAISEVLRGSKAAQERVASAPELAAVGAFLEAVHRAGDADAPPAAFGARETSCALEAHAVHTLFVIPKIAATLPPPSPPPTRGGAHGEEEEETAAPATLLDWLTRECQASGAVLQEVGTATEFGVQFEGYGGVGALLRYPFSVADEDEDEAAMDTQD
jgi:peptide subunit release factor 1 (eRF1)